MNCKVMKGSISYKLFDDDLYVSISSDSILKTKSFNFFVAIEAGLDRIGDRVQEFLDFRDHSNEVSNRSFSGCLKSITHEDH
jgi:hypothetical protein